MSALSTKLTWLLPRNWTIRVRLTALYGGLFFLAGVVLLGLTYLLVKQNLDARVLQTDRPNTAISDLPPVRSGGFEPGDAERIRAQVRQAQDDFRAETLDSLLTQGAVALALVGAAATALGWVVAGRVLRPLHRITDTARRIGGADTAGEGLHERIALGGPTDEIKQLADTFDTMLERLDRSFDGQRRFVANASHELRTPLAINRALIEVAVTRPDASADLRQLGGSLLEINGRHERLIDGLLTLADSENAITERTAVDLAEMVTHVVEQSAATAEEAGVEITTELSPAPASGDPVLIERLVQNLIENAIRHNLPTGGRLTVSTRSAPGGAELVVSNTGRPVPRYETDTIFKPFRRLTGERASPERGSGLGLSIVAAVARAHGGTVNATPRDGGGLVVRAVLPS